MQARACHGDVLDLTCGATSGGGGGRTANGSDGRPPLVIPGAPRTRNSMIQADGSARWPEFGIALELTVTHSLPHKER